LYLKSLQIFVEYLKIQDLIILHKKLNNFYLTIKEKGGLGFNVVSICFFIELYCLSFIFKF